MGNKVSRLGDSGGTAAAIAVIALTAVAIVVLGYFLFSQTGQS
ncbi:MULTISPECIES: hypothetical protein [Streptomyces]|jgi:hypothetical protein|uniref:Uncharacterized protein n=2 Tax=Streptomyces TaxID=1883 RepID=A0A1D8G2Q7_9ACTN|nr:MULTISPECIES: hypothetical protein [Streptomyces]AOT59723.1 hypothetical protein A4G23_02566 [Streptomyces rubrolavendulae]KAF0650586.1 hypothetical protein K701_08410 [Streptomyces fradiae ATCC 10745 = DSM 40063]OSY50001.1 hypothetical protein BG846_04365 [Streptomyces fradiae ATCC 10745 = DSM 40063]